MAGVLTLFKREYASYFNGPIAYIVLPVVAVTAGLFVWYVPDFFEVGQASLRRLFSMAPILSAVCEPGITMRLIAEHPGKGSMQFLA